MARFGKKLKNDLIYNSIRIAVRFFNIIPRDFANFIAAGFGGLGYLLYGKDRHKGLRHLRLVYGDELTLPQRKTIVRNLFLNMARNFVDIVRIKKHYRDEIRPRIDVEGLEQMRRAAERGRGVFGVTGHIGNFELLATFLAGEGFKVGAIGRELYDKRLNELVINNRQSTGLVNIDTRESPRRILKLFKAGYIVGVLMDTDSFRVRSRLLPCFGRLSNTPVGQSILGLRAGVAFVPGFCVRNGNRYKVVFRPEITVEPSGDFDQDVYNITRKCTEVLEEVITEYKDQWIWIHNRWHTRPEETPA